MSVNACSCDDGNGLNQLLPNLAIAPASLDFGQVPLGRERTLGVRLTNDGDSTLTFSSVALSSDSGEFVLVDQAPTALTPNQSVELRITYTAVQRMAVSAELVLRADDQAEPHVVPISGEGVVPTVEVTTDGALCGDTPGSLSFGVVAPGETVTKKITIRSTGAAPFRVLSAAIAPGASGEWALDPVAEGGVELNQDQRLELEAKYSPSDSGEDTAAFIITTTLPGMSNIRIPACGEGAQPSLCATPVPLELGTVGVGVPKTGVIQLSNCSDDALELSGLAIARDAGHASNAGYTIASTSETFPASLEPGETIDVTVGLTAPALGAANGWLYVETNAPTQPRAYFPITATAVDSCQVLLSPARVVYNNVVVGGTERRNVLLANNGIDSCGIRRVSITMGGTVYSINTGRTAPFELGSGASEIFSIRYTPTAGGVTDDGILEVETGATTHRVELLGNPPSVPGCQLEVQPGFINFGAIPRNSTVLRSVDVRNVSETPCTLQRAMLDPSSSPQFTNVQFAPGQIQPGQRTTVLVNYRAPSSGSVRGVLLIESDDVDSPTTEVALFGATSSPNICVEPTALDFGSISSGTLDFRVSACGSIPVTITDLAFTRQDPEFGLNNPPQLPLTLQPGQVQTVTVLYESLDGVGDSAVITVGSDDPVAPTIPVSATAGPVIVPPTAGRYLYYWEIGTVTGGESDVFRLPLQGQPTPEPFWGPRNGKVCTGCHGVSPDGRYVAVIEADNFGLTVIDTTTDITVALPFQVTSTAFFTWKPDVSSNPPYQFAYDSNDVIHIASVVAGYIGELQGANDTSFGNKMPSWGPNGQIAFARGQPGGGWSFYGPADIMLVDENGGVPVALAGAGGNGGANYYPAYSPNGEWVAFNHSASAQGTLGAADGEIWMAPTNQSGVTLRMPNANCQPGTCASSFPTWSLDGRYLSFSSNRAGTFGGWDLYIAPVDPQTGADSPAQNIVEANSPNFQHAARWSY
ncbi:choice-of-anchor D domain-containing protein [Myxococcota bacterium]|nr:choice-of-anchor D domain-containing protein [Myxococcota bacterium]